MFRFAADTLLILVFLLVLIPYSCVSFLNLWGETSLMVSEDFAGAKVECTDSE